MKSLWQAFEFFAPCEVGEEVWSGVGWSEGKTVAEHQSLRTNELRCDGGRRRLHLVGVEMMFWDTVGMSHHRVILVEASHAIHFIVDAAGDVLNVLHVGPTNKNTHTVASQKCPSISNHHSFYIFYSTTLKFRVQSVDR